MSSNKPLLAPKRLPAARTDSHRSRPGAGSTSRTRARAAETAEAAASAQAPEASADPHVARLSQWLELMLAEIERKQDEARLALEEQQRRAQDRDGDNRARSPGRQAGKHSTS